MTSFSGRPLEGQVALVTGASSGIGRAVATRFAAAGACVGVNYYSNRQDGEALVGEIETRGGVAIAVGGDVSQSADVKGMVDAVVERFGRLDVLIANAGLQNGAPTLEMTEAQWRQVIDVNLTGQFLCARAALEQFLRQPRTAQPRARGNIVFMSSVHEVIPWAGHVNYAASKGGLSLLMRSLAQEFAHDGVRVNAIAPGAIRTSINETEWSDPERAKALEGMIPYGRIGDPEDVAKAAVWLAGDESDYVVGTTLFVDGGMCLYPSFRDGG